MARKYSSLAREMHALLNAAKPPPMPRGTLADKLLHLRKTMQRDWAYAWVDDLISVAISANEHDWRYAVSDRMGSIGNRFPFMHSLSTVRSRLADVIQYGEYKIRFGETAHDAEARWLKAAHKDWPRDAAAWEKMIAQNNAAEDADDARLRAQLDTIKFL